MTDDLSAALRTTLARSEAAAARLLATAMRRQGNNEATSEAWAFGSVVSLGPDRYVNRLLCTETELGSDDIDATIGFFTTRNLTPSIQITSYAGAATTQRLARRGFTVDWTRVLLAAPAAEPRSGIGGTRETPTGAQMSSVHDHDVDGWIHVLAEGNGAATGEQRERSDEHARAAHGVDGSIDLLATVNGRPAACGSLQPLGDVAWLGGAATLPEFRGRGLQRMLLNRRLDIAGLDGYEHVAATALPDSTSARNLERAGLTLVDHQTVWTRKR